MFDKEFLKTLNIMYVEDDEQIRGSLSNILLKIFGNVLICNDGQEGIDQFKDYTINQKNTIDAVISDINMPNVNGIEMVRQIRELDEELPIVFTTAHGEANYLMDAIKLKVSDYALKPINTTELIQNIAKLCMVEHNKKLVIKKSSEITQYMDIMNHISSIFKTDLKGNIIEANDFLSEISQYSKEELESMKIDNLLHKDALVKNFEDIEKVLKKEDTYKGKIKFLSKNKTTFYLNSTIISSYSDSTSEHQGYIYIGIDQTNDELEKQQTMQRVRKNIMQQRTKESDLTHKIKELENQLHTVKQNSLNSNDVKIVMDKLTKEKNKVFNLNNQIQHYEEEFKKIEEERKNIEEGSSMVKAKELKKKKETTREIQQLQTKVIELQAKVTKLESKLKSNSYA